MGDRMCSRRFAHLRLLKVVDWRISDIALLPTARPWIAKLLQA